MNWRVSCHRCRCGLELTDQTQCTRLWEWACRRPQAHCVALLITLIVKKRFFAVDSL